MHPEAMELGQSHRRRDYRADQPEAESSWRDLETWSKPLLLAMIAGFVLLGAANLELGTEDATLGLAAGEPLGPLGRSFGLWRPQLWPGRVAVCTLASMFVEDGRSWPGTVLWPAALAAAAIGWRLARRLGERSGPRAGLLFGLCWFGCVGVIDHSGATGLEFLSGLATVAALDRLLEKGSDLWTGFLAAAALLTGGWPALAIVMLAVIVIGRPGAGFSWRLLLPPGLALAGWSAWVLATASAEALAAAIALPFTRQPTWGFAVILTALGLPFAPMGVLACSSSVRTAWEESWRPVAVSWAQIALACLIAGTIVPGLAGAAGVPALAGLLVAAAATLEAACAGTLIGHFRRMLLVLGLVSALCWLIVVLYGEPFCLLLAPYYRPAGIVVLVLSGLAVVLAWQALGKASGLRSVAALGTVAVALKLAHLGVFVPEWNYQHGQGPWGRAIGQWLLPNWTLYTIHDWPSDLAFTIGRPVRQLATPRHLAFEVPQDHAKHVLLLESEFEHWPDDAPRLRKVAEFQDRWGGKRILARTEGLLLTPSGYVLGPGITGARKGPW